MKWILLGCGGFLALMTIAVIVFVAGIFQLTQPVADAGNAFMRDLEHGDYAAGYRLATPALQAKLGDVAGLQRMVEAGHAKPRSWSFSSRSQNNNHGHLSGTATYTDGATGDVEIDLEATGSTWRVDGFKLHR